MICCTKPDAHSRQYASHDCPTEPESILPASLTELTEPDPGNGLADHLYVLSAVRSQVLLWVHTSRWSCHPGVRQTIRFLQSHFWWPLMEGNTWGIYFGLLSLPPPAGPLRPLPVPGWPWSHIALDFITGLPISEGNSVILTIIAWFSKAVDFIPLPKLPSTSKTLNSF